MSRTARRAIVVLQVVIALGLAVAPSFAEAPDLRLIEAVKRRDQKAFGVLVHRMDVNVSQPDGATALAWAAHLGEDTMADALIAAGADVNAGDEYGETPITLAAANGDGGLVERLLAAGASAHCARWNGESALMIAAGAGSATAVKALVHAGSDVNAAEPRRGQTALMWAAAEGHADVVAALIAAGVNVAAVSKGGFNALTFAVEKGDVASVKALVAAGADPNFRLPSGNSALLMAIGYRHSAVAAALIDGGADVRATDHDENSALHVAARVGDAALTKRLLAAGVNPNAVNAKMAVATGGAARFFRGVVGGTVTPLMIAAQNNHLDVMRLLVEGGANPALQADNGTTLVMFASAASVDVLKYAYELDPHVVVTNRIGQTPMHIAVIGNPARKEEEVLRVVQFLADNGAKLDELDAAGSTPMRFAEPAGLDKVGKLLIDLVVKSGATPKVPPKH